MPASCHLLRTTAGLFRTKGIEVSVDLSILMLAISLGAILQVGVGIGFIIIAGPPMMILLGTSTAVPILLLLNTVVSAVATDRYVLKNEQAIIRTAIIGCLAGVVAGLAVYPWLSEVFVLALTARVRIHNQYMTVAASAMADKKTLGHRS